LGVSCYHFVIKPFCNNTLIKEVVIYEG
jgi:hypothetical protein